MLRRSFWRYPKKIHYVYVLDVSYFGYPRRYIYIYIYSHPQTVSLYHNFSDTPDSRSWDRKQAISNANSMILPLSHEETSESEGNVNGYVSHVLFTYIRLTVTESSIHSKIGLLVCWVLWHINLCWLFNAKSVFMWITSSILNNSV